MVTVLVGRSERPFYINHEILCRYSLFFRRALGGSSSNVIKLPEDDETSFAVFAEWLYLGEDSDTVKVSQDLDDSGQPKNGGNGRKVQDLYDFTLQFKCYRLADKLQAPGFKGQIMDEIQYHGEFCDSALPTMEQVRYAYEHFDRDDPLWQFCVHVKRWDPRFRDTFDDPSL